MTYIYTESKVELAKPAKVYISSSNTGESMFNHDYVNKFKHPPISMSTWTSNKRTGEHFKIHAVQEVNLKLLFGGFLLGLFHEFFITFS